MVMAFALLSGCVAAPGAITEPGVDAALVKGPPIVDIVTPFDEALSCLRGRIQPGISFAVGQVLDQTGKEQLNDGGTGKFVTQGAGEMIQSALFRAGVTVVNRRDPNIAIVESNWGIRDIRRQVPVNFYVSGSINSLDFIPGGGASVSVAGVGPRYQQSRILIGLDMTLTDAFTGRIVASVPLQKQIFASEIGASAGRFFGPTLVSLDVGGMQREAIHFTLRQMLGLATFELLTQLMNEDTFKDCRSKIRALDGGLSNRPQRTQPDVASAQPTDAAAVPPADPSIPKAVPVAQKKTDTPTRVSQEHHIKMVAITSMSGEAARKAIASAKAASTASNAADARKHAAEAMQQMALAIQALRQAAAMGLKGAEGDAAALLVEQAMGAAEEAQQVAVRAESSEARRVKGEAQPRAIEPKEFEERFNGSG